jgi:hypothetical protein
VWPRFDIDSVRLKVAVPSAPVAGLTLTMAVCPSAFGVSVQRFPSRGPALHESLPALKVVGRAFSPNRGDFRISEVASGLIIKVNSPSFGFSPNLILPVQVPANRAASCLEGALAGGVVITVEVGEGVGVSSAIGAGRRCPEIIKNPAIEITASTRFMLHDSMKPWRRGQ